MRGEGRRAGAWCCCGTVTSNAWGAAADRGAALWPPLPPTHPPTRPPTHPRHHPRTPPPRQVRAALGHEPVAPPVQPALRPLPRRRLHLRGPRHAAPPVRARAALPRPPLALLPPLLLPAAWHNCCLPAGLVCSALPAGRPQPCPGSSLLTPWLLLSLGSPLLTPRLLPPLAPAATRASTTPSGSSRRCCPSTTRRWVGGWPAGARRCRPAAGPPRCGGCAAAAARAPHGGGLPSCAAWIAGLVCVHCKMGDVSCRCPSATREVGAGWAALQPWGFECGSCGAGAEPPPRPPTLDPRPPRPTPPRSSGLPLPVRRLAERQERQDLRDVHRDAVRGPPGRHAALHAGPAGRLHAGPGRQRHDGAGGGRRHRPLRHLCQGEPARASRPASCAAPPAERRSAAAAGAPCSGAAAAASAGRQPGWAAPTNLLPWRRHAPTHSPSRSNTATAPPTHPPTHRTTTPACSSPCPTCRPSTWPRRAATWM